MGFLAHVEITEKVLELHTQLEGETRDFPEESQVFIYDMVSLVAQEERLSDLQMERVESMWDRYVQRV